MGSWGKGAGKGHFIQYGPRWPRETLWASSPGEEFLGIVALQHKPGGVSGAWATLPLLFKWGGKAWPQSHTAEAAGEGSYVPGEGAPVQMTLCSACHGVGNPVVTIFQRPVQSQMLDTQVLRWLICDPGQASLAALRSEMPSHPSLTASVDPGCQEQAGVYFANKEAGWDHSQTCSRPPSLCRGQLKQTPWSTPLFSSFPHGMQGDRCSWTCHSRWLPSLPMKSALTLLTDGKFKTQDSSLATGLTCPSWNTRCFPTVLPSAPHPTVGENLSSAGCSGARAKGRGGLPATLHQTWPGPFLLPLWRQIEWLLNLSVTSSGAWVADSPGDLMQMSFLPSLGCKGRSLPLIFQRRHTYQKLQANTQGFMPGICSVSPPLSLQRPRLTFKKGHAALGKSRGRKHSACWCQGPRACFGDFPEGLSKQEGSLSAKLKILRVSKECSIVDA